MGADHDASITALLGDLADPKPCGTVLLPSLSVLTDRTKLAASPMLEQVTSGLQHFGYTANFDRGLISVSPTRSTMRPANAPMSVTVDTFMGGLTRVREPRDYRPGVPSSLTFTKATNKLTQSLDGPLLRPGSSGSGSQAGRLSRPTTPQAPSPSAFTQPVRPNSVGGERFTKLANTRMAMQQLGSGGKGMAGSTLSALAHSSWSQQAAHFQATVPTLSIPTAVPQSEAASSPSGLVRPFTSPQLQTEGQGSQHVAWTLRALSPPPGTSADAPSLRPSTPQPLQLHTSGPACFNMHDSAIAALRPQTGPSSHPVSTLHTPGHTSSRQQRPKFKPGRGHSLVVFQAIDKDGNGKVTLAELEEAAIGVGFTLEQSHTLFSRLDKRGKGFLIASDWGSLELCKVVALFTEAYMHRFMGLPGPATQPEVAKKFWQQQKLKSCRTVGTAIARARTNAILRASHSASGGGDVIFDAFRFIGAQEGPSAASPAV